MQESSGGIVHILPCTSLQHTRGDGSYFIDTIDSCHFVITNGPSQVFHLRATNEVERQRWVTALELAKAKAIKMLESG